jgi:hypothetical protein
MTDSVRNSVKAAAYAFWDELPAGVRLSGKVIAYSPIVAKSISIGVAFPDLDLKAPGIGIGGHRWAVTHSALAAWLSKKGIETIDNYVTNQSARAIMKEVTAAAGAGFCIGLSFHLLKDALWDQEQSIRFKIPFIGGPGTIISGTYLDDDLWLGANGLYAAKVAKDLLLMGFGEDAREAVAAFNAWHGESAVTEAVNDARRASMLESKRLSELLQQQIPISEANAAKSPDWIHDDQRRSIDTPDWIKKSK